MEMRAYAATKQQLDDAKSPADAPKGPTAALVWQIQHELFKRRKAGEDV